MSSAPPLTRSERGTLGAEKRWGNPANRKVVRLDSLSPEQRAVVLALIAAADSTKKAAPEVAPGTAERRVTPDDAAAA